MFSGKLDQPFNTVLLAAKICLQISICVGVLVTIIYCSTIDFYPSGLTIGDTLFFIAASLAFAVVYTGIVIATLAAGISISPFLRWLQPCFLYFINLYQKYQDKEAVTLKIHFPKLGFDYITFVIFGLIFISIILLLYAKDFGQAFSFTMAIVAMSFIFGLWHTPLGGDPDQNERKNKAKAGLAILTYTIPLVIIQANGNFINQSMDLIGVRSESSTVQLSKKYTEFLDNRNISYAAKTSEGEGVYKDVLVLFRGIGNRVVISVDNFSLSVESDNIIIGK